MDGTKRDRLPSSFPPPRTRKILKPERCGLPVRPFLSKDLVDRPWGGVLFHFHTGDPELFLILWNKYLGSDDFVRPTPSFNLCRRRFSTLFAAKDLTHEFDL